MKKIFLFLAVLVIFFSFSHLVAAAGAAPVGVELPNPLAGSGVHDFPGLIRKISQFVVSLVSGLAVIMFLWAGILFVTSAGNPGKIDKAKHAAIYAVIGVAIALAGSGLIAVITAIVGAPPA